MPVIVAVALAASAGGVARYGLQLLIPVSVNGWPWATFLINITGSFALGLVVALAAGRLHMDPTLRTAITVGFLGAYTTFSTLAYETWSLLDAGAWVVACAYIGATAVVGVCAVLAGTALGRSLVG